MGNLNVKLAEVERLKTALSMAATLLCGQYFSENQPPLFYAVSISARISLTLNEVFRKKIIRVLSFLTILF